MDIAKTRALLEKHGIILKKALGQNFLTEQWVPDRTVRDAGIDRETGVLEIGPGAGALTASLVDAAGKVAAVELDHRMIPVLRDALPDAHNLTVIEGDALKVDLARIVTENFEGLTPVACANLPYYITTPILECLLESNLFDRICVMVQKEVGRRICAKAGTSEYSSFSVYCSYYSEPKILFDVPSGCFLPRPSVDSSVVLFRCRKPGSLPPHDKKLFFRTLRAAFAERRKTLQNNLSREFGIAKPILAELIVSLGHPADVRGERLSMDDFMRLSAAIGEHLSDN